MRHFNNGTERDYEDWHAFSKAAYALLDEHSIFNAPEWVEAIRRVLDGAEQNSLDTADEIGLDFCHDSIQSERTLALLAWNSAGSVASTLHNEAAVEWLRANGLEW